VAVGIAFLLCFSMLIWASTWVWPLQPACLLMVGAGYEDNLALPANVAGWQCLEDLAALSDRPTRSPWWGPGWPRMAHAPKVLRVGDTWDHGLDGARESTVIVYFALHGGADTEGAYLLPQDADARPLRENRLRLESVIARLADLPAHQHKVLILDATRITVSWQLGMIQNDFARALDALGPRIASVPGLVVISASAPDQRSWASAEWRQTAFGHFLIEGLKGAATDQNTDARVSAWELYQYVRGNVQSWAWSNRQALQTPVLLPHGAEGERRARTMQLAVAQKYVPADMRQVPAFVPPTELLHAWERHKELAAQVPPPEAYTPALWRQYRDTLLRYEHLIDMGASPTVVARLTGRLTELELALAKGRRLDLNSVQNSLAMPAVTGLSTSPPDAATRRQFGELWNTPAPEQAAVWARLNLGSVSDRQLRRTQFYELLLDRAAEDPAAHFLPAGKLLRVLADPVAPRPIEAHYLAILQRDLPQPQPPADLLRSAMRTMGNSDRAALAVQPNAYPYSEAVLPWTQARVTDGDARRRPGQDLVFASDTASWDRARDLLDQAEHSYRLAQTDAAAVRSAIGLRDRVLARLPYYSQWLAQIRLPDSREQMTVIEKGLQEVEDLWVDTHQLVAQLEAPDPGSIAQPPRGDAANPRPRSLVALSDAVRRAFVRLEQRFFRATLALTDASLQIVWRDIDDALTVPDIDPALRIQLLSNQRRISRQLLIETGPSRDEVTTNREQLQLDRHKEQARMQGRLAIAVLGHRWFDACAAGDRENHAQARHRLDTFVVEENWWASVDRVGEEVGRCWRQIPVEINRLLQVAASAERPAALAALRTADRLSRLIDGAGSLCLTGQAAETYRRLQMQGLLLWLAQRTWEDHWFAEDLGSEPYYRVAGQLFVSDAARLDPRAKGLQTEVRAMERSLTQPGNLILAGPARRAFTTEQRFRMDFQFQAAEGAQVPSGYPVVWIVTGKNLEAVEPTVGPRQVRQYGGDATAATLTCTLRSPLLLKAEIESPRVPSAEPTTLSAHGLFRGQRLQRETRIDLYPLPETTVFEQPAPARGGVAVRGDEEVIARFGASNGAIAIVLDCSGSMGPPAGEEYGPATKYAEALQALRQVLRRLPKGTTVSVWVFGQAMGPRKTVADAERTVMQVQAPIRWDPDHPTQLRDVMAKVAYPTVEPWNESPIVRAMVMAKDDLKRATGFKTLLVLTDGMDNRFATDRELNPKGLDIPTFLTQTFRDSGIVVNMVGYKVVGREEKQAEAQFKVIEKLPLPGKFVTVRESKELAATLERALRQQLRYYVDRDDNVPLPGQNGGIEVSLLGANNQWFPGGLAPKGYKARVHTDRRLEKEIGIQAGDLLLVDLRSTQKGAVFQRGLYSSWEFPWKPSQERAGWRLAVLQSQALEGGGMQMLWSLEKTPDARESVLEMLRPRRTWIEVATVGEGTTPFSQRWGYRAGYPAPAWSLDVPAWPGSAAGPVRPIARIWWNPDQETTPAATLDRGADFDSIAALAGRVVSVDRAEVQIEGVDVEEHLVETRPGIKEKQSCLVVRLRHAEGKPVWAEAGGLAFEGREHRFFAQANASTSLFWPATKHRAEDALRSLRLYSVPAFKREAEQRGYHIELGDLKAPEASDVRPRPLLEIK